MRAIGPNSFPEEDNELLHTPLFKQVSPEQANELIPYLHEAVFGKGDYIFREGDRDHRMYLLERGRVKLIRESKDRRVQLLSIHAHGELLGEIPVFDPSGGPRTATAVAMTHGTHVAWLEHDAHIRPCVHGCARPPGEDTAQPRRAVRRAGGSRAEGAA